MRGDERIADGPGRSTAAVDRITGPGADPYADPPTERFAAVQVPAPGTAENAALETVGFRTTQRHSVDADTHGDGDSPATAELPEAAVEPGTGAGIDAGTDAEPPRKRRSLLPSLELNAFALMAATGITALVGLGFWAIAARLPATEVGRSSAILSTATMLSQVAASNVGLLFGRVLASAGTKARRLVLGGYAIAIVIALVLGAGFLVFFPHDELFPTFWDRAAFPLLVALLALSTLQDWVLTGLRRSTWIPLEQLLFALGKMGLLILFANLAFEKGILVAWALPIIALQLVISPILFLRLLPRVPPPGEGTPPMPDRRGLLSIFLAEYATGAVTVIIPLVLPLLVVARLGTEANAYYALPWLIAESFSVLIWNISSSYVVEASHDRREQWTLMKRTFRLSYLIGGLGVPSLFFLAPWVLSVLGDSYSEQGTWVLRYAVLAIPFTIINMNFINTSRLRNQMGRVVVLEVFTAGLVIGLAVVLMDRMGIGGAGLAFLLAQAVTALVVAVPLVRFMRTLRRGAVEEGTDRASEPSQPGGPGDDAGRSDPPTEPTPVAGLATGAGRRPS
ncbi:lipopolysaccharide biosynthesis protein [Pseudonocardia kujensis]|uniref:lipopolysaccharide biosynthesis protein n=1 Tax=Pseudonocardia kujensis TaxID=1128675 RepID=UPI001E50ACF6|nr:lipopolysaccharide biosynthesis protein [Pseudonocardia kujensis]MCE0762138.1 lipopolysaccharide biosynthesis protein [Pseudonocardia kujensis]